MASPVAAAPQLNAIEEQLDKARNNLKGLNESIRKIVGRPINDDFNRNDRKRPNEALNRRPEFGGPPERQMRFNDGGGPPVKRRVGTVFSRLSGPPNRGGGGGGDDPEPFKPRLLSRVIKEQPTRDEIVAVQCNDEESKARNRRIFGSLLGTLQKFCQEENKLKPKEEKKKLIEKKLEDQANKERERLRREKQTLFADRKRQQLEIRLLELKAQKMKDLAQWETSFRPLSNHIKTKSKPHIYFLPKTLDARTEERLAESRADIEAMLEKKRQDVLEEIAVAEERFRAEIRTLERNGELERGERNGGGQSDGEDYDDIEMHDTRTDGIIYCAETLGRDDPVNVKHEDGAEKAGEAGAKTVAPAVGEKADPIEDRRREKEKEKREKEKVKERIIKEKIQPSAEEPPPLPQRMQTDDASDDDRPPVKHEREKTPPRLRRARTPSPVRNPSPPPAQAMSE